MILLLGMLDKYSKYEKIFDTLRRRKISVAQFHLMLMLASREANTLRCRTC